MIANDVIGAFRFVRPPIGEKDISPFLLQACTTRIYYSVFILLEKQIDVIFICCVQKSL